MVRRSPSGEVRRSVKYRSSDGSTRLEQSEGANVQISNFDTKTFFALRRGEWVQSPLKTQPMGGKPFMHLDRGRVAQVPATDPRVKAAVNIGIPVTFYEFVDGAGNTKVYCPELNMLDVYAQYADGVDQTVTKVVLGEPAVAFTPPPGSSVRIVSTPSGPGLR
jgi:hypothetical protein